MGVCAREGESVVVQEQGGNCSVANLLTVRESVKKVISSINPGGERVAHRHALPVVAREGEPGVLSFEFIEGLFHRLVADRVLRNGVRPVHVAPENRRSLYAQEAI